MCRFAVAVRLQPVRYCMRCDDVTHLWADRESGIAVCPSCGYWERLPLLPVFVITGASGAGKTTIVAALVGILPHCEVFETDLLLDYAASTWDNLRSTWLMVAHGMALNGRPTVLSGTLLPEQLDRLPARRYVGPIRFCNLDAGDEVLSSRLRARPAWRRWDDVRIEEHQAFAAHLRATISPTISTTDRTVSEVAADVAGWVNHYLADRASP